MTDTQQPVAWMYQTVDGDAFFWSVRQAADPEWTETALYAAPQSEATDTARLDWLELCIRDGSYQSIIHDIAATCYHAYKHFGKGPALRSAIDGARAMQGNTDKT